ncbi:MAG: hypothetical protein ACK4RS_07265 [Thiothrix sp.]
MKQLIVGVGTTLLAVPSIQAAWSEGDTWRTVQANQSQPVVRVVRHYQTAVLSCEQCRVRQYPTRAVNRAGGWQRSAKVNAHPIPEPLPMYAYAAPVQVKPQQRGHRIVGVAPPQCRYIR